MDVTVETPDGDMTRINRTGRPDRLRARRTDLQCSAIAVTQPEIILRLELVPGLAAIGIRGRTDTDLPEDGDLDAAVAIVPG